MRSFAKKRVPIHAVQWPGGMDMVLPLLQLLGHKYGSRGYNLKTRQLELISGEHANIGDWICASPDGELFVVENTKFHELYEEIDEAGQPPPTDEHEGAVQLLTQGLDRYLTRCCTPRAATHQEHDRQGAGPMKLPTREM